MNSGVASIDQDSALLAAERPNPRTRNVIDTVRNAVLRRVRKAVFGILDLHTEFEVLD